MLDIVQMKSYETTAESYLLRQMSNGYSKTVERVARCHFSSMRAFNVRMHVWVCVEIRHSNIAIFHKSELRELSFIHTYA